MKTYKNLYPSITSFENLLEAAQKAAHGKRERYYVLVFFQKLEDHLYQLRYELKHRTYKPGDYSSFYIYQPKKRQISAAPFRDRVVHHALINIIGPILEKRFIHDSYANRKGKGTHEAIRRYQYYLRKYRYVLKCDIKKYFPTIDHEILKSRFRRMIDDERTLWLIDTIIDNSNEQEFVLDYFSGDTLLTPIERRKGLPIGNLTSQYFANLYLDPFDHFVKEQLKCMGYLRYVDDFVLFSDSKLQLQEWFHNIELFLNNYRLKLNAKRTMIYPSRMGTTYLGQTIFKQCRRLQSSNVRSFKKRLRLWEQKPPENLSQSIAGWLGHAQQADTERLRRSLAQQYPNFPEQA